MKKKFKIFAAALAAVTVLSPASLFAKENDPVLLSKEQVSTADKFITFDKTKQQFNIDTDKLLEEVSSVEYEQIVAQVNNTNENISKSMMSKDANTQISAVDLNGTTLLKTVRLRKEGKNDLEYHWNYVRVYLSATTVRIAVGAGCVIGGFKVEATAVKYALGFLGVGISELRSGIWFDYNYLVGVACLNAGFQ